jgi:sister chromatid cohesion protein DCC1
LTKSRLSIKSSTASENAVLTADDKTYQLRQVQTSNSVFLTIPSLQKTSGSGVPIDCIKAIASCGSTLEVQLSSDSPLPLLRLKLLPFNTVEDFEDVGRASNGIASSKEHLFQNLPFSDGELERSWRQLCAFAYEGRCWLPSSNALFTAWMSIFETATAEGITLTTQFFKNDILKALGANVEESMLSLYDAIIMRLVETSNNHECVVLNQQSTITWVGVTLLKAKTGAPAGDWRLSEFLKEWCDAVPETWRNDAKLEAIEGRYQLPTPSTITTAEITATNFSVTAEKPAGKARKWHDMFKSGRKQP